MANPVAVATQRAFAEQRLNRAVRAASEVFEVEFSGSELPANRFPDLAAAENTAAIAEFIEAITANQKGKPNGKRKPDQS